VVWDPFLGSGLELVECARLGSYRRLLGSDLDPRAIEAARENLTAASIERVELLLGDALELAPKGVTLILSNPPMGRRVARDGSVGELLERFTTHAADVLEGGGRMVWLSPLPRLTARAAERAKLLVEPGPELDMGGFSAQIQVFKKARP
jgi:tRNA G10  N-methylase Trm11